MCENLNIILNNLLKFLLQNQSNWLSTWNQELSESQEDIKSKYTNLKDKKTPALRLKVVNDPKSNNSQNEMELLKAILAPEKNVSAITE